MLELYQAEWCPYSHKVRERLTELGVSYVVHQAEPFPEERGRITELTGNDEIPVLVSEDGEVITGTESILGHLDDHYPSPNSAEGHRQQDEAHDLA